MIIVSVSETFLCSLSPRESFYTGSYTSTERKRCTYKYRDINIEMDSKEINKQPKEEYDDNIIIIIYITKKVDVIIKTSTLYPPL